MIQHASKRCTVQLCCWKNCQWDSFPHRVFCRRLFLWGQIWSVVNTNGTGPQQNLQSVPPCQLKFAQEMDREQVNGAPRRYFKVRGAITNYKLQDTINNRNLNNILPEQFLGCEFIFLPESFLSSQTNDFPLYLTIGS